MFGVRLGFLFLFLVSCERIRTEHLASSSYLRAEVVAGGTMSFSSSSEGIGEGFELRLGSGGGGLFRVSMKSEAAYDFLVKGMFRAHHEEGSACLGE